MDSRPPARSNCLKWGGVSVGGRGLGGGAGSRMDGGMFGALALAREDQSSAKRSHALQQRGEGGWS